MHNAIIGFQKLLILSICTHLICQAIAFADTSDVFPLVKGLRQVYNYQNIQYSWSLSANTSTTDSGWVECAVEDSATVNDTTVAWTVTETMNVVRRTIANYPPTDTMYSVFDLSTFTLIEYTSGNHELRSPSPLWEFPITFQNGQSYPVFRFSDSSHVLLTHAFGCMHFASSDYDTLWLSSDSGLFRRSYSRCFDRDEYGWTSWRNIALLSQTVVSVKDAEPTPRTMQLFQNYPNPFNPTTRISYYLPRLSEFSLIMYDVLGREVMVLSKGVQQPGRHEYMFDGSRLGSGVYFVRLQGYGEVQSTKMILLK